MKKLSIKIIICFLIGHKFRFKELTSDAFWGWNILECKRCKKKYCTLTDSIY